MDELKDLLEKAQQLLAQPGVQPAEVDQWVAYHSKGAAKSLAELQQSAQGPSKWGLLRPLAQGALFGFTDELAGAGAALVPGGQGYTKARDAFRAKEEATRKANPKLSRLASLVGALVVPVGAAGLGAKGAVAGTKLLRAAITGAKVGGAAGVLQGAGDAPELSDVPAGMVVGGGIGAVAGGTLGALLRPVSREATVALKERQLALKALKDAGLTPAQAHVALKELETAAPGQAILADVSPRLGRELRASVNAAPSMEVDVREVLGRRQAGQAGRLAAGAEADMGVTGAGAREARLQTKASLGSLGKKLYDPMEVMPVTSPAVVEQLQIPEVARLFKGQTPTPGQPVMFGELQALRGAMMDAKTKAFRAGAGNEGSFWQEQVDQLTRNIEEVVPGFKAANKVYAGATAVKVAYIEGAKATQKASSEVHAVVRDLQRRGGTEALDAYRLGYLEQMTNQLRRLQTNRNAASKFAEMGEDTEKTLRVLFPTDALFERFLARAKTERAFKATADATLGGSTTAKQLGDLGVDAAGAAAGHAIYGIPHAIASGTQAVAQGLETSTTAEARANLGQMLLQQHNSPRLLAFLQALQQRAKGSAVGTAGQYIAPQMAGQQLPPRP